MAELPEIFDFKASSGHLVVRCFPAEYATEFPRLPQSERRATPAVIRRLFATAAQRAVDDHCLFCEATTPVEGRIMIAVERDGGHELGVVCADCARLGELDARTQS